MFPIYMSQSQGRHGTWCGTPDINGLACGSAVRWSRASSEPLYHQCCADLQPPFISLPIWEVGTASLFLPSAPSKSFLGT